MDGRCYPPSEDSYLLLDGCIDWVNRHFSASSIEQFPLLFLEVGCAGAYVLEALIRALEPPSLAARQVHARAPPATTPRFAFFLGSDINLEALRLAREQLASLPVDLVCCSLLTALRADIVDVVAFNSPYVETSPTELREAQRHRDLRASWAGGRLGLEVAAELIAQFAFASSSDATTWRRRIAWLLLVTQDRPCWQLALMANACGLIERRRVGDERLIMVSMDRHQAKQWCETLWSDFCTEQRIEPEVRVRTFAK
ncbi:hypothetical protein CCYA_CCYA05G1521 [Cyanidiococcus yangmingshanensis]|nr:hypothetical protein CCYA_CCYA05G1521 [Cyanidiococcus yangmingshanensis]